MNSKNNSSTDDYIQTFSGQKFYFLSDDIDCIKIEDICHSLCHIPRFNGHTNRFYCVGEHSWIVFKNGKEIINNLPTKEIKRLIKLYNLIDKEQLILEYCRTLFSHDFGETYDGDMTSPLKKLIPQFKEIDKKTQNRIERRFELKIPINDKYVKQSDLEVLISEKTKLFNHSLEWELDKIYKPKKELLTLIYGYYPESAKEIFMDLCKELYLN